jgi:predicted nucleotidyltransferase
VLKTREQALRIVQELHDGLAAIYGERLRGVYLYGSYARGEAVEDSDIDVAVVLEGPVHGWAEGKRTIGLVSELCLRENCIIVPFFLSEEEHRTTPYAIHRSIAKEGVAV